MGYMPERHDPNLTINYNKYSKAKLKLHVDCFSEFRSSDDFCLNFPYGPY